MSTLSFNECTLPVGQMCDISSLKAALKRFIQMNRKGFLTLERVTKPGLEQVVWVSRNLGRIVATLPVFIDEQPIDHSLYTALTPIRTNELIEHKGYFYRTYQNSNNEVCIRAVVIFPDENSVCEALRLQGLEVGSVELVQFHTAADNKYLLTAWLAKCKGADVPHQLICVDLRENEKLDDVDFDKLVYEIAAPGCCFTAAEQHYKLQKDDAGKLYIAKNFVHAYRRRAKPVYHQELPKGG